MTQLSIAECRRLLGKSADALSDADVIELREQFQRVADVIVDGMKQHVRQTREARLREGA